MSKCENCLKYEDCSTGSGLTWPCGAYVPRAQAPENIHTYPEMDETIKDLLRRSTEPMNLYILARIEKLEKENADMLEAWKGVCEACGFNGVCDLNFGCEYRACAGHRWRPFWIKQKEATPQASRDPAPDVLMFIGRFSTDGNKQRREVVEAFTTGGCYWFAFILAARFGAQYGAEIVTDYVANHFATRISDRVYDITGDVTEAGNWEVWADCEDLTHKRHIVEDCIMF